MNPNAERTIRLALGENGEQWAGELPPALVAAVVRYYRGCGLATVNAYLTDMLVLCEVHGAYEFVQQQREAAAAKLVAEKEAAAPKAVEPKKKAG